MTIAGNLVKPEDAARHIFSQTLRLTGGLLIISLLSHPLPADAGPTAPLPAALSVTAGPPAAHPVFDWHAGKRPDPITASAQKKVIIKAQTSLSRGATWICSPSGSGRGSHCRRPLRPVGHK